MGKMLYELEREGAAAFHTGARTNQLIEPLPRTISQNEPWLVNLRTGAIERNSPLMTSLGDTIYKEYDPTDAEIASMNAGARVLVSREVHARLQAGEVDDPVIIVPAEVRRVARQAAAAKRRAVGNDLGERPAHLAP